MNGVNFIDTAPDERRRLMRERLNKIEALIKQGNTSQANLWDLKEAYQAYFQSHCTFTITFPPVASTTT